MPPEASIMDRPRAWLQYVVHNSPDIAFWAGIACLVVGVGTFLVSPGEGGAGAGGGEFGACGSGSNGGLPCSSPLLLHAPPVLTVCVRFCCCLLPAVCGRGGGAHHLL